MPSLSIKFGIREVVSWTKLSAWMLCQERPGIPHTTGYFDILMRINLAPLLDHVMHQVLIMRYVHTRITFSSRITLQSCIALFLLVRKKVGINATWGVQSDGLIFLDLINFFVSFSFSGSRQWTFMLSDSSGV